MYKGAVEDIMNNNDRKKNSFWEINEHQKIALAQKDGKELNKLIAGMDSGIHLLKNEGKKERPRDDMHGTAKDCGSELPEATIVETNG